MRELLQAGYTDVVDADLSKYFDTIPHGALLKCVARRIVDGRVLHLIKMWLTAAAMERDEKGNWRNLGRAQRGTPQGGVMVSGLPVEACCASISPLLANLYLNRFLKYWRRQGKGEELKAEIVCYADDFVILTRRSPQRRRAWEARRWTQQVTAAMGLTLNEQKTRLCNAWQEPFDFLGYTFGPQYWWQTGKPYLTSWPSKKSTQRFTADIHELLHRRSACPWPEVRARLNASLRGWRAYFSQGAVAKVYDHVNRYVEQGVRQFLRRRHRTGTRGTRPFPTEVIFGELGVQRLRRGGEVACAGV